jgi:signal transduction histidine kinase
VPVEEPAHELLLRELGRLNSDLSSQRRLNATTLHDLAAPTQVVLGLAELVLDMPTLDPVVRSRMLQLHRSTQTMVNLIADLNRGFALDDITQLEVRRIDLVSLVTSVVERTRVLSEVKGLELLLLVEQPDDLGCWVDADAMKIERALSNVLGNAIKFSDAGSTVSVALDRGVDSALISVHDEGPGIASEARERIFEANSREHGTSSQPGQGLGLFITRRILEGHGGSVSVRSTPGAGSTFLIQIPLAHDPN